MAVFPAHAGADLNALISALDTAQTPKGKLNLTLKIGHYYESSAPEKALEYFLRSDSIAATMDDIYYRGSTQFSLGGYFYNMGDNKAAVAHYEESIRFYEQSEFYNQKKDFHKYNGRRDQLWRSKGNLALAYNRLTEFEKATALFEEVEAFYKAGSDTLNWALSLINLAPNYHRLHQNTKAIATYEKAMELLVKVNRPDLEGMALLNLGNIYINYKQYESANGVLLRAQQLFDSISDTTNAAYTKFYLGKVAEKQHQYQPALEYYQTSLNTFQRQGNQYTTAVALHGIGAALSRLERHFEAISYFKRSLQLRLASANKVGAVSTAHGLAGEHLHLDQLDSAKVYLDSATVLGAMFNLNTKAEHCYYLAKYYGKKGMFSKASELYQRNLELKDSIFLETDYAQFERLRADYNASQLEVKNQENRIKQQDLKIEQARASRQQVWLVLLSFIALCLLGSLFWYREFHQTRLRHRVLQEKQNGLLEVIKAENKMREKVARDLHDGLGQRMTSLQLHAHNLFAQPNQPPHQAAEPQQQFIAKVDALSQELRSIANQIKPQSLVNLGLIEALKTLIDEVVGPEELLINLEYSKNELQLTDHQSIEIYRICQELINNTLKHARASTLELHLLQQAQQLHLIAQDNGRGFTTETPIEKGSGLLNIKTRVEVLGGELKYQSLATGGVLTKITIPT